MKKTDRERVPCRKCDAMILPATAEKNNGLCAPCHRQEIASENSQSAMLAQPAPKAVKIDEDEFDNREKDFLREIISRLKEDLENLGIPPDQLRDATATIAFSVAATLDNCGGMLRANELPLIPVLTFAEDMEYKTLVARSGGTYMHEFTPEIINEIFKKI
jgi:hypothetical protein